jgi:hypothetical protein
VDDSDARNELKDVEPTLRDTTGTRPDLTPSTTGADLSLATTTGSRAGPSVTATLVSPLQALHLEEIRRILIFLGGGFAAAVGSAVHGAAPDHARRDGQRLCGHLPAALWLHRQLEGVTSCHCAPSSAWLRVSVRGTTESTTLGCSPGRCGDRVRHFLFSPSTSLRAALAISLGAR